MAAEGKRTEDQSAPAERPSASGRPAFVVAFPTSGVVPVPPGGQPFGRDDILRHTGRDDPKVSGRHFCIQTRGRVAIEDLGSRNGTWVEGVRLKPNEPVTLDDGALVRVGGSLLVYRRNLIGAEDKPSAGIGKMVAPYGLRTLEKQLNALLSSRTTHHRNILIQGETGTGKELLAREIANRFGRARLYGAFNSAALPETTIESHLFGYTPGAFTGALSRGSHGVFLDHHRGAVFLDEIGDLPPALQPKLLRLLENREVVPVGASRPQQVDVLVIGATNRSLQEMVEAGTFRRDLFARFEQPILRLPALRDRREDIFAIVQAWLTENGTPLDPEETEVEAVEPLLRAKWQGNVRELGAKLAEVAVEDRAGVLHAWAVESVLGVPPESRVPLDQERVERMIAECGGNEAEAARRLGVHRGRIRRLRNTK